MTPFFTFCVLCAALGAGIFLLLRMYAPTPIARQLRMIQLTVALQLFRHKVLSLRSRDLRMLYGYRKCVRELNLAVVLRNGFEARAAEHGPKLEQLARRTDDYAMIQRYYDDKLAQAAAFLGNMPDEQLQSIAKSIRDEMLSGFVPVSTVADFLKGERQAIKEAPYMAVGHFGRMVTRMKEIRKAVLVSAIRGLAKRP